MLENWVPYAIVILFVVFLLKSWINILREYERAVVFRLGRLDPVPRGPRFDLFVEGHSLPPCRRITSARTPC